MWNIIFATVITVLVANGVVPGVSKTVPNRVLSSHEISMDKRYNDTFTNNVFKENILLTIAYGRKIVSSDKPINWDEVNKPFHYSFQLDPGKVFTFHNMVSPKYAPQAQHWNEIHYYTSEGYLSDGWLIGDGVCHLASIMFWSAKDAGLGVEAPTNHDFAAIPQVPKEDGVAIYYAPNDLSVSSAQNLYVKNTKDVPVLFVFDYDGTNLKFQVEEASL